MNALERVCKQHDWTEAPTLRTVALTAADPNTDRKHLADMALAALMAESAKNKSAD